jgi:LemA protein
MGLGIFLVIVALLAIFAVGIYNKLIKMRIRVDEAWSDIDVQLKRRYDLIPNLVETVKGYAKHENQTFQEVMEARSKATAINVDASSASAEDMMALAGAEQSLTGALGRLFAVAENYPDLKANQNFLQLQTDLTDTEDKIQASRRFYNGTVRDYNTKVETVPSNFVAMIFSFTKREFFDIDENQRENIQVKF